MTQAQFDDMMEARQDLALVLEVVEPFTQIVALPNEWVKACGRPLWDDFPPQRFHEQRRFRRHDSSEEDHN